VTDDDLSIAAERDAAGDREAALNALARAARRGHAGAMTRLGKRLLVADRAPWMPRQGAGLLIQATEAGDAEAAARLSVLAALGLHVRQSWADALDLLTRAADRNWLPAQAQLRALAPDVPADAPWGRQAASVRPADWLNAPASKALHADPEVRAFEGMISPAVCAWLIETAKPKLMRARVYDSGQGVHIEHETRSNGVAIFNTSEVELVHLLVQARMSAACGMPMQNMEAPSVLHYRPGQQFADHYDFIDPANAQEGGLREHGQRVITFLVYLNDDFEGGETDFPRLGLRFRGRPGEGLFFVNTRDRQEEPDARMLHAGRPPTAGGKWVVSQFVRGRPFIRN
jgi:prolyl 4-hydroxylase